MNEKNKIKYIIIFILFLIFVWFFVRDKSDEINMEISQETYAPKERAYSRISFFHIMPVKASLSIPEEWEGKYRMRENGDTVNFYYIGGSNKEKLLFQININNVNNLNIEDGEIEIVKKDDFVFNYKLSTPGANGSETTKDYEDMLKEVPEVVLSLKVF